MVSLLWLEFSERMSLEELVIFIANLAYKTLIRQNHSAFSPTIATKMSLKKVIQLKCQVSKTITQYFYHIFKVKNEKKQLMHLFSNSMKPTNKGQ